MKKKLAKSKTKSTKGALPQNSMVCIRGPALGQPSKPCYKAC